MSNLKAVKGYSLQNATKKKNQYPTFSMDAVRGVDLTKQHKADFRVLYYCICVVRCWVLRELGMNYCMLHL